MTVCLARDSARPATLPPEGWVGHLTLLPAASFRDYVSHYWITRWDRGDAPSLEREALLEPCVHLQLRCGSAEVIGILRQPYRIGIEGSGYVAGIRFRTAGFSPFAGGSSPAELTGQVKSAAELLGQTGTDSLTRLSENLQSGGRRAENSAAVQTSFDALLQDQFRGDDRVSADVSDLCDEAKRSRFTRVSALARAAGCSPRTVYRLFSQYVGVSPSWLLRRYRLYSVVADLKRSPESDIPRIALAFGYADQAHLTREFRAILGVPPGRFTRQLRGPPDL